MKPRLVQNITIFVFALVILTISAYLIQNPSITGLVVYEGETVFEAESLTLSGTYSSSSSCACSSPSQELCIRNYGNSGDTGNAIYNFNLEPGLYDIVMKHCPESDGNDAYRLYLNSNLVKTFNETSDSQVWEDYTFDGVYLKQGDQVKISCSKSSYNTYCRIDQITFKKININVTINTTIADAEHDPINATIKWVKKGQLVKESFGKRHNYQIEEGNYDLEIIPEHNSIRKIKLNKSVETNITDIVDVDYDLAPDTQYSQAYAVDSQNHDISNATVTINATGTELFKCREWDFENRECNGEWTKLMDTVPGQEYTFVVDCGYKEKGGCSCKGIRYVVLKSNYSFANGTSYSVKAEVFQGASTNPSQLIDSETVSFNSLPQTNIDNNPGSWLGNLIIERINQSSITIKFHNETKWKIIADNTFRLTVNSTILGPDTIHLSCSTPINIGDVFGDFEVIDIDKIMSGYCKPPAITLISPVNNSNLSINNVTFEYKVYDPNASISLCKLIINGTVYQTDYSIAEGTSQFFYQNLANGSYRWSVNCTNSNGHEAAASTWYFRIAAVPSVNDTTAPVVALIAPVNNSINTNGSITFQYNVTDNSNISICKLIINENAYQNSTNVPRNITQSFIQSLPSGSYIWQVNCTDQYNHTGQSTKWNLNVSIPTNDTTAPVVALVSPANNSYDTDGYVTFDYNVTDASPINNCKLIINSSVADTDYSITRNITQSFSSYLTNGSYIWYVNCTDTYNNTGQSKKWIINVNITTQPQPNGTNVTKCCCGLIVSTTPEVVNQGEKVLVTADVSNLLTGLAALPSDISSINVTIYRIGNATQTTVVNNASMTYLADGLWYYEFNVGNNATGNYVASVTMRTNQTSPFIKEASDSFTVGDRIKGLTIVGVSPDLININQTTRLAAEIKYNGVAIDSSLITNASLIVQQLNGTFQVYNVNNSLQVEDGMIYVDGTFNETGVYYLDWTIAYLGESRTAREIVVVVGWEKTLQNISYTINIELLNLIKENRQSLLELLTNMEYMQQFSEEEVFLITDSVNSMTKIANYLENGKMTNEEAEKEFNQIQADLNEKLGHKITGSAIGDLKSIANTKTPVDTMIEKLKDWRLVLFIILVFMFTMILSVLLMMVRMMQTGRMTTIQRPTVQKPAIQVKTSAAKPAGKRRYEILMDKVKKKMQENKANRAKTDVINKQIRQERYERLVSGINKVKDTLKRKEPEKDERLISFDLSFKDIKPKQEVIAVKKGKPASAKKERSIEAKKEKTEQPTKRLRQEEPKEIVKEEIKQEQAETSLEQEVQEEFKKTLG